MRFALVNNARALPEPKLRGLCPVCSKPVSAKCGKRRIWHWAHRGNKACDPWWKPETEWHRTWKNNFPLEWHEFIHHDQAGEKHIADVRTEHGLIIEFQNSPIDPQERAARERFYGNMIWVVNGMRHKKQYCRFLEGKMNLEPTSSKRFFLLANPEKWLPAAWLESPAPVIFDFREPSGAAPEPLWCLAPDRIKGKAVLVRMSRDEFVMTASSRSDLIPLSEWIDTFAPEIRQLAAKAALIETNRRHAEQVRIVARPNARRWRGRL